MSGTVGAEPWDTEWAAQRAADALCYLGRKAPEVLENSAVLDPHKEAAHQAAMRGEEAAFLEALAALAYKEARNGFTIPGVGKLVIREQKARTVNHPQTGQPYPVPKRKKLKFLISKTAREAVLGGRRAQGERLGAGTHGHVEVPASVLVIDEGGVQSDVSGRDLGHAAVQEQVVRT